MVVAARRAYSDLQRWMKTAAPRGRQRSAFGRRAFLTTWTLAVAVLGVIGLLSPARFGAPGSRAFGNRAAATIILVVVLAALIGLAMQRARIVRTARTGWTVVLEEGIRHPHLEGALGALQACPAPLRTRFAATWVWGPAAVGVLAVILTFSSAYFLVDLLVSAGGAGPQGLLFAVGYAIAGCLAFLAGAGRLATWPLAATVRRLAQA